MSVSPDWKQKEIENCTQNNHSYRFRPDMETPSDSQQPPTVHQGWRWNFIFVTLPFIFFGFPLNVLLWSRDSESLYLINSSSSWIYSFFNPCRCSLILTLIFFMISLTTYYIIVQAIYQIIYDLLYLGVLAWDILGNFNNLVRYLPLALPLLAAWLWGYNFKKLIRSFDYVRAEFQERLDYSWRVPPKVKSPLRFIWLNTLILYLIIACILTIIILIDNYGSTSAFSDEVYWISFYLILIYNLTFPVYCMCCWAIQSEFEMLSLYLSSLVQDNFRPTYRIFCEIKDLYKKISYQVFLVNAAFSHCMSYVIFIAVSTGNYAFGRAGFLFGPYFMAFIAAESDPENAGNFLKEEGPPILRITVGYAVMGLLYYALILVTAQQAIKVNSAARYVHVHINDFVSHTSATVMTPELYQSYRLLKFYIHSTMEQIEKPVLLRIAILNYFPYFGTRLHTYNLRF